MSRKVQHCGIENKKSTRPHSPAYAVTQDLTVLLRALREDWLLLKSLPFDAQVFRLSRQQNPQTPATVIGALGLAEIGDGNVGCGLNHNYLNFFGDSNPDREQGLILFIPGTSCQGHLALYEARFPLSCSKDAGRNATCVLKTLPVAVSLTRFSDEVRRWAM